MDCLFCKIIDGEIPSTKVYEDEFVFAFKDIAPIAPVHYLIIPKVHISCANEITEENSNAVAKVFEAAAKIAKAEGIESYRQSNFDSLLLDEFQTTTDSVAVVMRSALQDPTEARLLEEAKKWYGQGE